MNRFLGVGLLAVVGLTGVPVEAIDYGSRLGVQRGGRWTSRLAGRL